MTMNIIILVFWLIIWLILTDILFAWYVSSKGLANCNSFIKWVLTNWIAFLSKYLLMSGFIMYYWDIIPINIQWTGYQCNNQPQLIPWVCQCIYILLHGYKLSTKNWYLYCRLTLWELLHHCSVHIYQETTHWSVRHFVSCMITIHKHVDNNLHTFRFWGVPTYSLFGIPIEFWPITCLKETQIYFWVQRVIHQSGIVPLTNMGHDVQQCFLIPPLWEVQHGMTRMKPQLLCHFSILIIVWL